MISLIGSLGPNPSSLPCANLVACQTVTPNTSHARTARRLIEPSSAGQRSPQPGTRPALTSAMIKPPGEALV